MPGSAANIASLKGASAAIGKASMFNNLASVAGIGLMAAGLFGNKGPEIDQAIEQGKPEEAQKQVSDVNEMQRQDMQ